MTCHLIEAANQTETEINLFLAKHVAKKVRINGEESSSLPKVIQNSEKEYILPFCGRSVFSNITVKLSMRGCVRQFT